MPDLLLNVSQYKRNSVESRQCTTARRLVYRRAAYEGDALGVIAKARAKVKAGIMASQNAVEFSIWCKELDRLLERERILLRIPLPVAQAAKQISRQPAPVVELQPSPELQAKLAEAQANDA